MRKKLFMCLITAAFACAFCAAAAGCSGDADGSDPADGEQAVLHVAVEGDDESGDGSEDKPFRTVSQAIKSAGPGTEIVVHEGTYEKIELDSSASGEEGVPVVIRAAEGEKAVIKPGKGKGGEDSIGIHVVNADNIIIDGLEVEGGTHGIFYESTRDQGEEPLQNITIKDCTVHGIRGTHGICVYACNDLAPVTGLTMEGCHVYDCECGSSESTVFNGNIDGFVIKGNKIHDNNNIGIDMIGFEGTAKHPKGSDADNPYDVDFARNGECFDNVVYGISAEGNEAYLEDGEYDLCADGIYVDGGQDIEIYNNFIFNCDIGLEVATEHSPDDNELFKVSGVSVHDNVIADCTGWCGICFGGYDRDLGYTEGCEFNNNTLVDNDVQIGVQRSRDNKIHSNLLAGGELAIELNTDCRPQDLINDISGNVLAEVADAEGWNNKFGDKYESRDEVLDGFKSLVDGCGSGFVPDEKSIQLYESWRAE